MSAVLLCCKDYLLCLFLPGGGGKPDIHYMDQLAQGNLNQCEMK